MNNENRPSANAISQRKRRAKQALAGGKRLDITIPVDLWADLKPHLAEVLTMGALILGIHWLNFWGNWTCDWFCSGGMTGFFLSRAREGLKRKRARFLLASLLQLLPMTGELILPV